VDVIAPGWKLVRPPAEVRAIVQYMVRNFDRDPVRSREILRDLILTEPRSFLEAAVGLLKNPDESRGAHYLVTLIVSHDLLLQALSSRAFTQGQALLLARAAMRVDSLSDVTLARQLADSASEEGSPLSPNEVGRLMEILAEISDGPRVVPSLMRMLRHPNPYLRSKAVKLIGRGGRSIKWVRSRLAESDPRIRANAIEAIWGLDSEEARELLRSAARDGNNRVAGNVVVALYRIGDCAAIGEMLKMAAHGSALFRATAAWAMGETGDPRFSGALAGLMRDSSTAVRTRALLALGRIKAAVRHSRQGTHWHLSGLLVQNDAAGGRRLQLTFSTRENADAPDLPPTAFLVFEDGHPVTSYAVAVRPMETMSVVFVFPRAGDAATPWIQAALDARAWKRPSDLWAFMPYLAVTEDDASPPLDEPPQFSASFRNLEARFRQPVNRADCSDVWRSLWRCLKADQAPERGQRHLVVFSHGDTGSAAGSDVIALAASARGSIQVVSRAADPHMEDFCRRVRGRFVEAEDDAAVTNCLCDAYLNLLAQYAIGWTGTARARELKLRVHSPSGWGELKMELRKDGEP